MTDVLSPAQTAVVQAAAVEYAAGKPVREIARHHRCSVALLYRRFRESGVQLRGRAAPVEQQGAEIVAAYAAGLPMREICARYGIAKSTVGRLVDEAGVPRRPSGKPRRVDWDKVEAAVLGGMSAVEAAAEARCTPRQVARLLSKLGWAWDGHQWQPPRSGGEAAR